MKTTFSHKLNWLCGLLASALIVTTVSVQAGDEPFDRLAARWKVEREQILRHMTQAWLRGEKPETFKNDLLALSQIESGLATQSGAVLYLSEVENTQDLNATVGDVVRAYLKHKGGMVNTGDFMRGKTFSVLTEGEIPPNSENAGKTAPPKASAQKEGASLTSARLKASAEDKTDK